MSSSHVSEKLTGEASAPFLKTNGSDGFRRRIQQCHGMREEHDDPVVPKLDWSSGIIVLDRLVRDSLGVNPSMTERQGEFGKPSSCRRQGDDAVLDTRQSRRRSSDFCQCPQPTKQTLHRRKRESSTTGDPKTEAVGEAKSYAQLIRSEGSKAPAVPGKVSFETHRLGQCPYPQL
jgi:hypothetical protein